MATTARRVVVTGAAGAIGRRVTRRLVAAGAGVLAIDKADLSGLPPSVDTKRVDLASADLASLFAGADVVVHLASAMPAGSAEPAEARLEMAIARRVLDAMTATDVAHHVMVSSAMVYGAWVGNPVPLTEECPVRPNPDFDWAVARARLERLACEWRGGRPGRVGP
ncbi:MAG: NAD-dependent epimerase/dehydratase family protein, partial [Acidimicrobiales bacterium]